MAKVLSDFTDAATKAPRRFTPIQYYQHVHYDTRIKHVVEAEYEQARQEAIREGRCPPVHLTFSNKVSQRMFNAESAEFKAQLMLEMEEDHQRRMTAYQAAVAKDKLPATAEEYHECVYCLV